MSQTFCSILLCACLWCVYYVTKAGQAMESTAVVGGIVIVGVLDTLCFASFCVGFESCTDEHVMLSNSGIHGPVQTKNIFVLKVKVQLVTVQ